MKTWHGDDAWHLPCLHRPRRPAAMKYRHTATALTASVVIAALLASCSNDEASSPPTTQTSEAETAATTTREVIRFRAGDGVELVGRLWGEGDVGVILAHGFSQGQAQDGWLPFPAVLAERGYLALTFNFRGFCDSEDCSEGGMELGNNWRDAMAAVALLEERGAKKIFLIGASMGGLAVLRAARTPGVDVAGVVSLSTPQFPSKYYVGEPQANDVTPARLKQIDEPKLFIAGKDDVQLPGSAPLRPGIESVRFAEDARRMFAAAEQPKQLALVDSSFHSSYLLTTAPDHVVKETSALIFRFLEANS
jgi:pimeloyl-ACP methyl ester carboxylesterase